MIRPIPLLTAILFLMLLSACGTSGISRLQSVEVKPVAPEIALKHIYYATEDSLHLILKFEDENEVIDFLRSATSMEYFLKDGYGNDAHVLARDSLLRPARKLSDIEGKLQMGFNLPVRLIKEPNILHIRLWYALVGQDRRSVSFMIPMKSDMLRKHYLLTNALNGSPLFTNYLTTSSKLVVRQYGNAPSRIEVQYFSSEIQPALPPMSTRQEDHTKYPIAADTFFYDSGDTLEFKKEGIYLFGPGENVSRGIMVQKWAFPKVTMTQEMLMPLIYITTSSEREALYKASNAKDALDDFWLKTGKKPEAARELIRTFYGRVETANKLFSSFKPGWATDRGMIYIVYGRPSNISHVGNTETWIYRESEVSPYVKFVFNKKENNFTENHYELVRSREYEDSWYSTVAKWRAGITEM